MNRNLLIGAVIVILLAIGGYFYVNGQNGGNTGGSGGATANETDLSGGEIAASAADYQSIITYGDPNAPIKIIEFASMTCGHCADFHSLHLPTLKSDYIETGKVYLEVHPFPLDMLAAKATMLAACGGSKNAAYTDVLFKQQRTWTTAPDPIEALAKIAKLGGMSRELFDSCMANEDLFQTIVKSRYDAQANYQISGTPAFVIDGKLLNQAFNKDTFSSVLD